jgi:hypothetical protein
MLGKILTTLVEHNDIEDLAVAFFIFSVGFGILSLTCLIIFKALF